MTAEEGPSSLDDKLRELLRADYIVMAADLYHKYTGLPLIEAYRRALSLRDALDKLSPPTQAAAELFTSALSQESAGPATAAPGGERICLWTDSSDGFRTAACNKMRVRAARTIYKYCPYCGGKIIVDAYHAWQHQELYP